MHEIMTLLQNIDQVVPSVTLRQLLVIVPAVLTMTGQVTMLNISRWSGEGGSYRTIQRFYNTPIVWLKVNWSLVCHQLGKTGSTFLLVGDETVVTKSGKKTYGLDRFFSSIYGKVVPGLSFFGVSLVSVEEQESTMLLLEQLTKEETTTQKSSKPKPKKSNKNSSKNQPKNKGGRPQGSKNQNRRDIELPTYLQNIQGYFQQILDIVGDKLAIGHAVLDGAFGNNNALQMVRRLNLHLISKLNRNAALYFPYTGEQKAKGRRRIYGSKLDYDQIPDRYLKESTTKDDVRTDIYQMQMRHKLFPDLLNIVIVFKTKLDSGKRAHVVLFSSDLNLAFDKLILYYRLRFQIEFNFRDAKQFWGLEDFMNVNELPVYNAANFAIFMRNLASLLIRQRRAQSPDFGVHDLKAEYRGRFYAQEALKLLPDSPDPLLIDQLFAHLGSIGAIHP